MATSINSLHAQQVRCCGELKIWEESVNWLKTDNRVATAMADNYKKVDPDAANTVRD